MVSSQARVAVSGSVIPVGVAAGNGEGGCGFLRWQRTRESGKSDDKNDKTKSHSRFLRDRTRLKSLFRAGIKETKRAFLSTIAAILLFLEL